MKSKMRSLKIFGILILSSCATTPYPYFDSAFNDKNRAPASITSEVQEKSSDKDDSELNQRSKAEYFFLKGDLLSQEGKSEQALEAFKEAHYFDPNSGTVAYRIAIEYFRKSQLTDAVYWGMKAADRDPKNRDYKLFIAGLFTSQRQYEKAEEVYLDLIKEDSKYAEPVLYLAALYSEQKKFKQAQDYFSKLVQFKDYEQRHLGFYYRGRIEFESGLVSGKDRSSNWAAAKKDLEKALELKPDLMEALQILGRILEKKSGREAAFKFYEKYQKSKGPFPKLAETLSQYYIEKGDFDGAYEQLEIVEKSSDDDIGVKLKLALILIDRKDFKTALEKLEKLNQLVPDSDKVKFYTGAVLEELNKDAEAVEMYMAIPVNSSHFEDSRINTSQIYKKAKKYEAAVSALEEVLAKKQGKFQVYLTLAQVYEEQSNWPSAIVTLKEAEKKFADNNQINYFLGILYDRSGDFKNMKSYMKKAIAADKNHYQSMNYLAYTMAEKNENLPEARDLAQQAYKLASDDGYIIDTLGWIYYKLADYDKAEELLEKAHEFLPEVAVIAEHLGDVYLKRNKHEKATKSFRKALKVETDEARKKAIKDKISMVDAINPDARRPASSLSNKENKDE
jgi:tetratricopeptide (TPR) repeat protein